jgi:hypothetical protein
VKLRNASAREYLKRGLPQTNVHERSEAQERLCDHAMPTLRGAGPLSSKAARRLSRLDSVWDLEPNRRATAERFVRTIVGDRCYSADLLTAFSTATHATRPTPGTTYIGKERTDADAVVRGFTGGRHGCGCGNELWGSRLARGRRGVNARARVAGATDEERGNDHRGGEQADRGASQPRRG